MYLNANSQVPIINPANLIMKDPLRFFMNQSDGFNKVFNYLLFLSSRFQTVYICQERIGKIAGITRIQANRILKQLHYLRIINKTFRGIKKTCLYKVNNYFYTPEIVHKLKGIFKTLKIFLLMFILTFKMSYSQYLKKSSCDVTQYNNIFLIKNIISKGIGNFTSKTISKTETITKKDSIMTHNLNKPNSSNNILVNSGFKNVANRELENSKTVHGIPNVKQTNELLKKMRVDIDYFLETMKFLTDYKLGKYSNFETELEQWFYKNNYPSYVGFVLGWDHSTLSDNQKIIYNLAVEHHNLIKPNEKLNKII